jgi:tetratricopeptide (TPR) repeat protein
MDNSLRIEELKRRVQMDPASIAFAALAEEYRRAGMFDEAMATCTAGLRRHPVYISAHVTLGRTFVALGRLADARAEFSYVLDRAPENLAAIRGLAEIHNTGDGVQEREAASAPHPVEATDAASRFESFERSLTGPAESSDEENASTTGHAADLAPALGGLEEFLGAITRARTERLLCREGS